MRQTDITYSSLLSDILKNGEERIDRTGVGTFSVFGRQYRYDLSKEFPLITTKNVHFKSVVGELLWFLSGSTNVITLRDRYGVTIWDEWADAYGKLGPIYGKQWRSWESELSVTDQIAQVIKQINDEPASRRLIVSAWNVADIPHMKLAPCHIMFQFYVSKGRLSCQLYQRSADAFLGVPFNIASYGLLTHMIAQVCNLKVGELIHSIGDLHLYKNHKEQALELLKRGSLSEPTLSLDENIKDIDSFTSESIKLIGYKPHPSIKASVAV